MGMSDQMQPLESRRLFAGLAIGIGSTGVDFSTGITTDAAGNFYVTGTFQGKVDFKPGTGSVFLTAKGQGSAFVAKYTSTGALVWAKMLGSELDATNRSPFGVAGRIAVDKSGNVYTTGIFNKTEDFAPSPGTGGDIYITKLDTNGNIVWNLGIGSSGLDGGTGIAVDGSNNVLVTGTYSGTVDFAPGKSTTVKLTSQGQEDAFLAKYTNTGKLVWVRGLGGAQADAGIGVAVDSLNEPFVVGVIESNNANVYDGVHAPTVQIQQNGVAGAFIVKASPTGNLLRARSLTGLGFAAAAGIGVAIDPSDNVFVAGAFAGTVDFDPGAGTSAFTSAGGSDGFIAKFSGGKVGLYYAKRFGGSKDDAAGDVKVATDGSAYVTGFYHGNAVSISGGVATNLASKGRADQFLARFRNDGKYLGARSFGNTMDDWGTAVAIDPKNGYVYDGGFIDGTVQVTNFFNLIALNGNGNISIYRTNLTLTPV
jgi:hypothetical protein